MFTTISIEKRCQPLLDSTISDSERITGTKKHTGIGLTIALKQKTSIKLRSKTRNLDRSKVHLGWLPHESNFGSVSINIVRYSCLHGHRLTNNSSGLTLCFAYELK